MLLNISNCIKGVPKKILIEIGKESLLIMGTHQHIMLIANCIVGSEYWLQVQVILIVVVVIYETLLISLNRCRTHNANINNRNKSIREKWNLDTGQAGKEQDETKK